MQKYKPQKISSKRKKINEFIMDETQLKVGSRYIYGYGLLLNQNTDKSLILIYPLKEHMLTVAECFIVASLINNYGKYLFQHQTTVWSMVSTSSMPVFESRSPYLFSIGEKCDRKNIAICKDRTI